MTKLIFSLFLLAGFLALPAVATNQSIARTYGLRADQAEAATKKTVKKIKKPAARCQTVRVKVGRKFKFVKKCSTTTSSAASTSMTYPKIFGGTFDPAFEWTTATLEKQMAYLSAHDITWIRFVYVPLSSPNSSLSDRVIAAAQKYDIKVVLVLEPDSKFTDENTNYTEMGKYLGEEAAQRFGWYIDYYQLANEVGGTALKAGDGQEESQYDLVKYSRIRDAIAGMEGKIENIDPTSKTIISNQWLHYAMLDMLIRDNVRFDIIGWNWFPDGVDMDKVEFAPGKTINLLDKLRSYNKEVWLTEFNRDHGSYGDYGEEHQANYLQERLQKYNDSGVFSAIFIHGLFDNPTQSLDQDRHWGLIWLDTKALTLNAKPALDVFSSFIRDHR